jgi:CDP-6-deoxy-D-xylo-4-hexulose-3-dehydrase
MIAHTLGNPFDLKYVKEFCERNNLWLIEDNCDALGSKYFIDDQWKYTGTIGDIGTSSFYPPHHITMGEGGAVYTNNLLLSKILLSFRDWGRDCWCKGGVDNTCGVRFSRQYGELPLGYDHKYVYSHFGYNLKVTDMQAAIGCAQLDKLDYIVQRRIENHDYLYKKLKSLDKYFILPQKQDNSEPSWFGFVLTIKDNAGFKRNDIVKYLEDSGIQTRLLFSGNLLKHPAFVELKQKGEGYRVYGELNNTDKVMNDTFWLGVYPGLKTEQLEYISNKVHEFINGLLD